MKNIGIRGMTLLSTVGTLFIWMRYIDWEGANATYVYLPALYLLAFAVLSVEIKKGETNVENFVYIITTNIFFPIVAFVKNKKGKKPTALATLMALNLFILFIVIKDGFGISYGTFVFEQVVQGAITMMIVAYIIAKESGSYETKPAKTNQNQEEKAENERPDPRAGF